MGQFPVLAAHLFFENAGIQNAGIRNCNLFFSAFCILKSAFWYLVACCGVIHLVLTKINHMDFLLYKVKQFSKKFSKNSSLIKKRPSHFRDSLFFVWIKFHFLVISDRISMSGSRRWKVSIYWRESFSQRSSSRFAE